MIFLAALKVQHYTRTNVKTEMSLYTSDSAVLNRMVVRG